MSETFNSGENMRSKEVVNEIINQAILEVIETFEAEILERDKEMLLSVAQEKSTDPSGRIIYLRQISKSVGVSEIMPSYVNNVLETLRQNLNEAERNALSQFGNSFLDDVS